MSTATRELDVAFCCDCTGSMSAYIKSAQDNIRAISIDIHTRAANCSVRFALVKYRDHPPQDSSFITEVFPFTESINVMKNNVDTMAANGGGDGPEAVSAALKELSCLDWRPNATKVGILIADAPPHGLGETGDGFPNGCPLGTDPIVECKTMAAKGITIYSVGVEPILSTQYKYARDFMMCVAKITNGKFLPLGRAEILSQVVVSGALEGLNLQELWDNLEKETKAAADKAGERISETELVNRTEALMAAKKSEVRVAHVKVENPYEAGYDVSNCNAFENATSLASARPMLSSRINAHATEATKAYRWSEQRAMCEDNDMDDDQVCRRGRVAKKTKGLM